MRRWSMLAWGALAWCALASCTREKVTGPQRVAELSMSDRDHADQLASGFYELEEGRFRWTGREFAFTLHAPRDAAKRGARLTLSLYVAPEILEGGAPTLSCIADGVPIPPEPLDKPGPMEVVRDVPPLDHELPVFTCTASKTYKPGGVDQRELGVVVTALKLQPR
jgi:hypothetical protein